MLGVTLACWLLKRRLNLEDRNRLVSALLKSAEALPLTDTIYRDDLGRLVVNGKHVDHEFALKLRESAKGAQNNFALKFVHDHTRYLAITKGVHEHLTPEQGLFAKAALWHDQQVKDTLKLLAQE